MVVTVPENQWFAIGFGVGMINVDMVLFTGSGFNGSIKDMWSTANSTPVEDTNNAYAIGSTKTKVGSTYNFTAYRALNTLDASQDRKLECGKTYEFNWSALSTSSTFAKHDKSGKINVTFAAAPSCTVTFSDGGSYGDSDNAGGEGDNNGENNEEDSETTGAWTIAASSALAATSVVAYTLF